MKRLRSLSLLVAILLTPALFGQYGSIADLKLAKPEDGKDQPSTPAPKDALILFDGKNLDAWTKTDGKSAPTWKLVEGGAAQVTGGGNIITKEKFGGTFKLHVEF